jgi:hypothetical protein
MPPKGPPVVIREVEALLARRTSWREGRLPRRGCAATEPAVVLGWSCQLPTSARMGFG